MKLNKKILTLLIASLSIGMIGCSKKEAQKTDVTKVEETNVSSVEEKQKTSDEDLGNYSIELIDDTNIGNTVRETMHIVVDENCSLDKLYKIAQKEALKYTKEHKVNALTIGFYTDKEHIGKGYDMGSVLYAPNGELADAINIQSGDYSSFKFVNNLEEPLDLPKGESLEETKGATDVETVKNDVSKVESSSIVNVSKNGSTLVINIKENKDHPYVDAEENAIGAYTDWCLDNIKSDISTIDITVERPSSSVHAILDMNNMLTDNGRYFDTNYIRENIQ